jgi:hypothetical protein
MLTLALAVAALAITGMGAFPAEAISAECNGVDDTGVHVLCFGVCYFGHPTDEYQEGVNVRCGDEIAYGLACANEPLACSPPEPPLPRTPLSSAEDVQPGAGIYTDRGLCTLNFAFEGNYVGTAGHCALGVGERHVWAEGIGPTVSDVSGRRIGRFVYADSIYPKDFALIKVDPGINVWPRIPIPYASVVRVNRDVSAQPALLEFTGMAAALSDAAAVRIATSALGFSDPNVIDAQGVTNVGDSGAPVITTDGSAVGVVVASGVFARPPGQASAQAGTMMITRLGPQIDAAEEATGIALDLITSPADPLFPCCPESPRGGGQGDGSR